MAGMSTAVAAMIPPWGNLFIELLKATALVSLITVSDLTFKAYQLNQATLRTVEIFLLVLFMYLGIALVITFCMRALEADGRGASIQELEELLGRARAKKGMFEGDTIEGELEIGQVSGIIKDIKPAAQVLADIWSEFTAAAADPFKY